LFKAKNLLGFEPGKLLTQKSRFINLIGALQKEPHEKTLLIQEGGGQLDIC
jgi:hypothetical protein